MKFESMNSSGAQHSGLFDPADNTFVEVPAFAIRSGPRKTIYHDPKSVTAAICTCGGLCPGLNDVVQNIVYTLVDYGVPEDQIFGIRYGLRGFLDRHCKPVMLSRKSVEGIQLKGGTVLVRVCVCGLGFGNMEAGAGAATDVGWEQVEGVGLFWMLATAAVHGRREDGAHVTSPPLPLSPPLPPPPSPPLPPLPPQHPHHHPS